MKAAGSPVLGIDVGAHQLHCVELSPAATVGRAEVVAADDSQTVARWAAEVGAVAIDAPAAPSSLPHAGDAALSPKFRVARCAEIELGRRGIWVPWVPPAEPPFPAWMSVGFSLFERLGPIADVLETYPHAVFRVLAGRTIPPKRTAEGRRRRADLLRAAGVAEGGLVMWEHDGLDALAAALVASLALRGQATAVTCGHDGSGIWLPESDVPTLL